MSSQRISIVRVVLAIAGLLSALFFAWWIPLVFMTLLAIRWSAWEVPVLGLLIDLMWLPTTGFLHPIPFFLLFGIAIVWIFEPLRTQFLM